MEKRAIGAIRKMMRMKEVHKNQTRRRRKRLMIFDEEEKLDDL
jgi:hypothetical protein